MCIEVIVCNVSVVFLGHCIDVSCVSLFVDSLISLAQQFCWFI